jgi:hypothetical protein
MHVPITIKTFVTCLLHNKNHAYALFFFRVCWVFGFQAIGHHLLWNYGCQSLYYDHLKKLNSSSNCKRERHRKVLESGFWRFRLRGFQGRVGVCIKMKTVNGNGLMKMMPMKQSQNQTWFVWPDIPYHTFSLFLCFCWCFMYALMFYFKLLILIITSCLWSSWLYTYSVSWHIYFTYLFHMCN